MIAAIYVDPRGCYAGLEGVEVWGLPDRDAREYPGPHAVVAHPPCSRWCRLAGLVEARWGHRRGEDGGCFAAALASVRRWGGVLEHPAYSDAWAAFDLPAPHTGGGVAAGAVRRVVVPRRTVALRTRREEGDVAVCVRRRPAGSPLGVSRRRALDGARLLVRQPRRRRRGQTAARQARGVSDTARVPRRADLDR